MGLTQSGDDPGELLRALRAFASGQVQHDVAVALAQTGQSLVREGFVASKAPDGQRWAPLKRPRPGGPVLVKGRRLSAAAALYTVTAEGFVFERVDALTGYGGLHQTGAPRSNLPRRPYYPDDRLSIAWEMRLAAAADEAMGEHLP